MVPFPRREKIQKNLLRWYERHGRNLPWRKTRDPYTIWVSEIMLQQTQVDTVIPYYERFLKLFPTVRHLARADLSKVLKIWEGLGYYSRARNLHRGARMVLTQFGGKLPVTLHELLTIPGIGKYTAGAILSIAFNKEAPILDGNVKRVLSRVLAIRKDPRDAGSEQLLWKLSESLIPKGHASAFNQALMDLGATICTPRDPRCLLCPVRALCRAVVAGNPEEYPARKPKKSIPSVEAVAAVICSDGNVLLRQRPPHGLLGGLWEFPNWKSEEKGRLRLRSRLRNHIKKEMRMKVEVRESLGTFRQTYSHFKLTLHVYRTLAADCASKVEGAWVPVAKLHRYPMSRIHRRIAQVIADQRSAARGREESAEKAPAKKLNN